jgi:hypothetical protein
MEKIGISHKITNSTSEFDDHHLKIMFYDKTNSNLFRLQNTTKIPYSHFSAQSSSLMSVHQKIRLRSLKRTKIEAT